MPITKATKVAQLLNNSTGFVKNTYVDSDAINTSASLGSTSSSAGTTVYATLGDLPGSASTGAQAFVSSNNGLYIYNGSGWYKVALVNATPYWDSEAAASYEFTIDTPITITLLAGDSDGHLITYTATPDSDANQFITITKDSDNGRIFTLTPDSENEAPANINTGTITFKASDGISFASTVSSFTLTFSTAVDNSAETVLLMKATGSAKAHEDISYQNGSDASLDIVGFTTTTGTPVTSSFSPYRSGGYSAYFDGTDDRIEMTAISDLSSTNYTIEMWVYAEVDLNSSTYIFMENSDDGSAGNLQFYTVGGGTTLRVTERGNGSLATDVTMDFESHRWYHLAVVWDGTNTTIYVDGVSKGSSTNNAISGAGSGLTVNGDGAGAYEWPGYIRDFRISTTARYTSSFTPPTEALTADGNTDVLLCHAPYLADGSTNGRAITISNNVSTRPFGPYDYNPHVHNGGVTSDVGSFYLSSGTDGVAETTNHQTISNFGSGDFTIECWYYPTGLANYQTLYSGRANTGTYGQLNWFLNSAGSSVSYASSTGSSWDVVVESGTTVKVNDYAWNHVAYVRNGTDFKVYVNGVGETIATSSSTLVANTLLQIGYENTDANTAATGYISDYRIVKGTAVYTSNFTPPTEPLTWVTNTTLLLNNKYDTYIYDAAAAGRITLLGDAQSTTSQRKFTTSSSVILDGTGDYLSTDLGTHIGAGDFTVECWAYIDTPRSGSSQGIFQISNTAGGLQANATTNLMVGFRNSSFSYNWVVYANNAQNNTSTASVAGQWQHVALVRNSGSTKLYIDGTSIQTISDTTNYNATRYVSIGGYYNTSYLLDGYIQDFRVSRSARYTSNFTPPTAEFEL